MENIHEFLKRSKERRPRIAVVGDCGIDEYYSVQVNRISPEFPIEVFLSEDENPSVAAPAMAGNVCAQFINFNADVDFYGFIDTYSQYVLNAAGISTMNCIMLDGGLIPRKKRFYQDDFPLCRWDAERHNYGMKDISIYQEKLESKFSAAPVSEVVIFSDYQKGMFDGDPMSKRRWLQSKGVEDAITIVDSKNLHIEEWAGCTVFKPNAKEAEQMTGTKDWRRQCDIIQNRVGCMGVVITNSGLGVYGKVGGKHFEYKPRMNVKANSVIGAGDAFLSILGLGLSCGIDMIDLVEVAFASATIYVQNKHNKPIAPSDLLRHIDPIQEKFTSVEHLQKIAKKEKLIFTNGVFDMGLTSAHIQYLQKAKSLGDKLVIALNSDNSTNRLKPNRPIMPLEERMKVVAGLQAVDYVVSFETDTPLELIQEIMPSVVCKGGDYKAENVIGYGIVDVVIIEKFDTMSTTGKLELIRK